MCCAAQCALMVDSEHMQVHNMQCHVHVPVHTFTANGSRRLDVASSPGTPDISILKNWTLKNRECLGTRLDRMRYALSISKTACRRRNM